MYEVGDMLVDTRSKNRFMLITEIHVGGLEPVYYEVYIMQEEKTDVWSENSMNIFIKHHVYIYYPVVK